MSADGAAAPFVEVKHRGLITVSVMVAMIMQVLDTTIANVALPHMQASLGAAQDTITWVLTSYIVAAAIATPITGWLSDNIGRKRLFMICVIGFVVASALCGTAFSLEEMVLLPPAAGRLRRRARAAVAVGDPRHQSARAAGPGDGDLGRRHHGRADHRPDLGAWLTENFNWRWVFYINLPIGAAALAGIYFFMPDTIRRFRRFDFFGFAMLSIAVGSLPVHARPRRTARLVPVAGDHDRARRRHRRRLDLRRPHRHRQGAVPRQARCSATAISPPRSSSSSSSASSCSPPWRCCRRCCRASSAIRSSPSAWSSRRAASAPWRR